MIAQVAAIAAVHLTGLGLVLNTNIVPGRACAPNSANIGLGLSRSRCPGDEVRMSTSDA